MAFDEFGELAAAAQRQGLLTEEYAQSVSTSDLYDCLSQIMAVHSADAAENDPRDDPTMSLARLSAGSGGWVPENTQVGDTIALFEGAQFPFVIRPRDDGTFAIIGWAWMDGVMFGEAWPKDGVGVETLHYR